MCQKLPETEIHMILISTNLLNYFVYTETFHGQQFTNWNIFMIISPPTSKSGAQNGTFCLEIVLIHNLKILWNRSHYSDQF